MSSALQGLTTPSLSDPVGAGPTDFETLAEEIEKLVNMRFASVVARDATITAPEQGMICQTLDTNTRWAYTGSDWVRLGAASTYTPTLTNLAIGTGGGAANTATYTYVGSHSGAGLLIASGTITFGSSGATLPAASTETIRLPSGFNFAYSAGLIGDAYLIDTGTEVYYGQVAINDADDFRIEILELSGTYPKRAVLAAAIPHAWAVGDQIVWNIVAQVTVV